MFDFHMHSDFSADCSTPMEEMIEGAIQKGLKKICFTEHIDYEYPDPDFIFEFDMQAYSDRIQELQQKYKGKIEIYKGIELGLQPHLVKRYNQLMEKEKFDFAICSIHTVDRKGLHSGDLFQAYSIEESYEKYYGELLASIKEFHHFQVLGHLDLVKRYTLHNQPKNLFHDLIEEIFQVIIPQGKGIELNTSGERDGLPSGMPSADILKLYREKGGEIITIGSDAHSPEHIGFHFQKSLQVLDSLGYRYITTFAEGEPTFHSIRNFR